MLKWIQDLFMSRYLRSLVRGLLRLLSGVLIAWGIGVEETELFIKAAEPVVVGVLIFAITQLMSWLHERKSQKLEAPEVLSAKRLDK